MPIPPTGSSHHSHRPEAAKGSGDPQKAGKAPPTPSITVSRVADDNIQIQLASGETITLIPPKDLAISPELQITAIKKAMKEYLDSTVPQTAGNIVALRNQMLEEGGIKLADDDIDKIQVLLGQRSITENREALEAAFQDIADNGGKLTDGQVKALQGDSNSNLTKILDGSMSPDQITKKDFSIFALLLLLSQLDNEQYNSMSQLSRDAQINIQLQYTKKAETITEQAGSKFGYAMSGAIIAGSLQILGSGYALKTGTTAAASIGQLAGQLGGTVQQSLNAIGEFIQAGYQVKLTYIDQAQSQSNYIKENADDSRRKLDSILNSNLEHAKELTRGAAETMKSMRMA